MELGDKVARVPVTFGGDEGKKRSPAMSGRVVYIHPKGRYHTVEFMTRGGGIRESFPGA